MTGPALPDRGLEPAPGFPLREAHAHLYQFGRSRAMIDLGSCGSPSDLLEAFAGRRAASPGSALLGHGARPEGWTPARWPSLAEFDGATGPTPALAWCFDYHAILANSTMLARAGIDGDSPDPPGGLIGRSAGGALSGLVYESAAQLVWESAPEPPASSRRPDLLGGVLGLTRFEEIHDLKSQRWLGPLLREIIEAEPRVRESGVRFLLFPLLEDLDAVLAGRGAWECDRVRLGGAKVFVDGTLNSRTAWMLEPYADGRAGHPRGTPLMSADEIEAAVRRCDGAGLPLAAHAIGDGAVRAVLDAVERVGPATPGFRIEHAEVIDEADVPRFARLGVVASLQPCHLLCDIEALRAGLPHRLHRVMPVRELIDAGCVPGETLLFGSDVPIVGPNPEDSVLAATRRRRGDMAEADAVAPEQRVTPSEAWAAFRAGSAGR